jgi:hypothetical protein
MGFAAHKDPTQTHALLISNLQSIMSSERWGALLHLNVISVFTNETYLPKSWTWRSCSLQPTKTTTAWNKISNKQGNLCNFILQLRTRIYSSWFKFREKIPNLCTLILQARKEWTNALSLQLSPLVCECRVFQHFQLHCSHCLYLYHVGNKNQEHVQYLAMAPLLHQSQQNSVISVT